MKFPQQLLLKLTGLLESPPLLTPATPAPSPLTPPQRRHGNDVVLTQTARDLLRALPGLNELATRVSVHWNARLQTTAGTASPRTWEIDINPKLNEHGPAVIQRILRHELAHLVSVFRAGRRKITAHGPEWRQACRDLGIPDEPRCHSLPLPGRKVRHKYAYRCPHCDRLLKRVKALDRRSACYECCQRHNRGRYDDRFRYVRIPISTLEDSPSSLR